jgi:hypothetical protein
LIKSHYSKKEEIFWSYIDCFQIDRGLFSGNMNFQALEPGIKNTHELGVGVTSYWLLRRQRSEESQFRASPGK